MAPVRIGFLGISANSESWKDAGAWANSAHMPYLLQSPQYQIVALCNSSVEAAQAAIKAHGFPESTKAYGNPEDLAKDPDVELVVCSVNVKKHYELVKPSLLEGKNVIVEWPLGATLQEAEELTLIAKEKHCKTAVILQARFAPVITKIKSLLSEGAIGAVLSSTFVGACNYHSGTEFVGVEYHMDINSGGNMVTIHYGHEIDALLHTLGEFEVFNSMLGIKRPYTKFLNKDGTVNNPALLKTTPDQIMVQGELTTGAFVSSHFRGGYPYPGEPGLQWHIYGEKGEIRISCEDAFLQIGLFDPKLTILDHATNKVEDVVLSSDEFDQFPRENRNIARLYDAFAKGEAENLVDFEKAVVRHRFLDEVFKASEEKRMGRYQQSY